MIFAGNNYNLPDGNHVNESENFLIVKFPIGKVSSISDDTIMVTSFPLKRFFIALTNEMSGSFALAL